MEAEAADILRQSVTRYYRDELGLPDWECHVTSRLITERAGYGDLIQKLKITEGMKVLSVGSGWGGFAMAASKAGADSTGIEPDLGRLNVSIIESLKRGLRCTLIGLRGENIRFADDTFDVIDCSQVLEHVEDPEKVINEMIRVLKPGGICHIDAPNYLYPAEAHYKILWIPLMPKPLAMVYLKLLGRSPEFIRHINYITPIGLRKILRKIRNIIVIDIGKKPVLDITAGAATVSGIKRRVWNMWAGLLELFNAERTNELIIYKRVVEDVSV